MGLFDIPIKNYFKNVKLKKLYLVKVQFEQVLQKGYKFYKLVHLTYKQKLNNLFIMLYIDMTLITFINYYIIS